MMNLPTTVRIRLWPTVTVLVALLGGLAIFFATHKEEMVEIHTVTPGYRDLAASLSTNGKVTPIQAFAARAAMPAMVQKIDVKVGEKVKPGQLVVQLKDPFAESRYTNAIAGLQGTVAADENYRRGGSQEDRMNIDADLKRAETEESDAANRLQLLQSLHQKGDASEAEVSDAELRLQVANTTLQLARDRSTQRFSQKDITTSAARVADARATLETARQVLANANITSTIAGTVYSIPVSTYDFVPMGADLVLIANLDAVQIRAYFDEPDIGQLHAGQPVDVFWDGKPGTSWRGRVEQPPMTVFPLGARTVGECVITVDNSNGSLLPNTNVTVKVETIRRTNVMSIPREALHTDRSLHFVYRLLNGKIVNTPVQIGIVNLSFAEITGGLSMKDVIAVDTLNGTPLSDGLRVRTVN